MHRLRTVTYLDVSAVAGHHAMPAALLLSFKNAVAIGRDQSCITGHCFSSNHVCNILFFGVFLAFKESV